MDNTDREFDAAVHNEPELTSAHYARGDGLPNFQGDEQAAREYALFDIEPEPVTPSIPHYWHETFQSYGQASARDSLPNLHVIIRITHSADGYHREAFGIAATETEAQSIVDRFKPLDPGAQWDIDTYVALPF
jgi:hypothetical protein